MQPLRAHVVVDERRAAGDAGDNIQPPISIGIFIRFHLIPSIALQKNLLGRWKGQAPSLLTRPAALRGERKAPSGSLQHIKRVYVSHMGISAQHLVGEVGENPPYPVLILPWSRGQQFFTVG